VYVEALAELLADDPYSTDETVPPPPDDAKVGVPSVGVPEVRLEAVRLSSAPPPAPLSQTASVQLAKLPGGVNAAGVSDAALAVLCAAATIDEFESPLAPAREESPLYPAGASVTTLAPVK
jgi:hypothetical protein